MITPEDAEAIAARAEEIWASHDWTLDSAQLDLIRRALGPIEQPATDRKSHRGSRAT